MAKKSEGRGACSHLGLRQTLAANLRSEGKRTRVSGASCFWMAPEGGSRKAKRPTLTAICRASELLHPHVQMSVASLKTPASDTQAQHPANVHPVSLLIWVELAWRSPFIASAQYFPFQLLC